MKKLLLCLLALAAVIPTIANAQEAPKKYLFGIRVGIDVSRLTIPSKTTGEKFLASPRTSFNAGITNQLRLTQKKPFYFEIGAMLHNKGGELNGLKLKLMYLEFPVGLNYHLKLSRKVAFVPFVGIYYGIGIRGKGIIGDGHNIYQTHEYDVFDRDVLLNRSDFGLRLGLGLCLGKFQIGISYDGSIANIYNKDSRYSLNDKIHNRTWSLSIGVNL